jgi:hypothetical protein
MGGGTGGEFIQRFSTQDAVRAGAEGPDTDQRLLI